MAIKSLDKSSIVRPQTTNSMLAGYSFQDYELIESVFVAATTTSVTFSNLNQYATEYKHLQIRAVGRSTHSANITALRVAFNGIGGTSYSIHGIYSNGGIGSYAFPNQSSAYCGLLTAASATAGNFAGSVVDILDAFSSVKNKTIRTLLGSAPHEVSIHSAAFLNTAAIDSMTLTADAGSIIAGSRFSLYGIR